MIRKYKIENIEETYLRIWQKVNFGKVILDQNFFTENEVKGSRDSFRISVYQFDPNTRLFYIDNNLYAVTSDELVYNYLDTGRAVTIYGHRDYSYSSPKEIFYFYNEIIITDKEIIAFEDYRDKPNLNLKLLTEVDNFKTMLIYAEDLDKIKSRLAEILEEEKRIEDLERQEEITNEQELEKKVSLIRQYDKMTLLEDNDTIIKDNYFVDKEAGLKVEFKDKVVKLFTKDELIYERDTSHFITMDYHNFLRKLEEIYNVGKYDTPIEENLEKVNKKWLEFKIYSYDRETKVETLLKKIKIENNINDKGKLRFKVNGIKMSKQKMSKVLDFLSGGRYGRDRGGIIERITNLESYLEKIRIFSGKQLELLEGKTLEISLNGTAIPIHFGITATDKENWQISIEGFTAKKNYAEIKNSFYYLNGGGLTAISRICDTLQAKEELEDILINKVKTYVEKRKLAEARAETLFAEFLDKNKTKVFKREGGYVVKGKLKNYLVKMKDEENCGVWSYPANEYICINEKTKTGQYLCKYDKLLQFCMCMLNDGKLREEIHTIR